MAARILIIEDNVTNLELMVYLMEAFGYSPVCARDGEAGVEIAQRETFSLIICDIQMPIIDGFEVARRLKSDPATSKIPDRRHRVRDGGRQRQVLRRFRWVCHQTDVPAEFVGQIEQFISREERGERRSPERVGPARGGGRR